MKKEINYIDYVRDAEEADIYIIITNQNTGSGGKEFSVFVVGQKEYSFMNDIQKYMSEPDASEEEVREGITNVVKMSLVRYIAKTPMAQKITITYENEENTEEITEDKWKSWVFEVDLGGWANGEEAYRNVQLWGSVSASKVTEDWKIETDLSYNSNETRFTIGDEVVIGLTSSQYWENLLVKSISEHWSVGGFLGASTST